MTGRGLVVPSTAGCRDILLTLRVPGESLCDAVDRLRQSRLDSNQAPPGAGCPPTKLRVVGDAIPAFFTGCPLVGVPAHPATPHLATQP